MHENLGMLAKLVQQQVKQKRDYEDKNRSNAMPSTNPGMMNMSANDSQMNSQSGNYYYTQQQLQQSTSQQVPQQYNVSSYGNTAAYSNTVHGNPSYSNQSNISNYQNNLYANHSASSTAAYPSQMNSMPTNQSMPSNVAMAHNQNANMAQSQQNYNSQSYQVPAKVVNPSQPYNAMPSMTSSQHYPQSVPMTTQPTSSQYAMNRQSAPNVSGDMNNYHYQSGNLLNYSAGYDHAINTNPNIVSSQKPAGNQMPSAQSNQSSGYQQDAGKSMDS